MTRHLPVSPDLMLARPGWASLSFRGYFWRSCSDLSWPVVAWDKFYDLVCAGVKGTEPLTPLREHGSKKWLFHVPYLTRCLVNHFINRGERWTQSPYVNWFTTTSFFFLAKYRVKLSSDVTPITPPASMAPAPITTSVMFLICVLVNFYCYSRFCH